MGVQPGSDEASLVETLYLEYLTDPMSVTLEWRQFFDFVENRNKASRSWQTHYADPTILTAKDDEAFRLFLDEPERGSSQR